MGVQKKYPKSTSALGRGLDDIGDGRGLDALIDTHGVSTGGSSTISEIALDSIEPNPNQPRRDFDQAALEELAASIRQIGIIQPITLRQAGEGKYQIIAGERRWRASQIAGLQSIPAYIRTAKDDNVMEMALVENIQREDLNPVEIALAYQQLLEQEGMTQEKVAERVGKSRAAIANFVRLLKLPAQVQVALQKHTIDTGHARALLALDSPSLQVRVFNEIQKKGCSVREVEQMVSRLKNGGIPEGKTPVKKSAVAVYYAEAKEELAKWLGSKVQLTGDANGKGKITIPFGNEEDLRRLMGLLAAAKG